MCVDECNDPTVPYQETFEYTLGFSGGDVTLGLGDDLFATGRLSGCTVDYESVVWSEVRDGAEIRWKLSGTAQFRQGGTTCNLEPGIDWLGTETFEIVSSEDPSLPTGCQYILDAQGTYVGDTQ